MSILPSSEIRSRLGKASNEDSLIITPRPRPEAFDPDSVDLRLGTRFLQPGSWNQPFLSPDSDPGFHTPVHVPLGEYLVIPAHQTVLGATLEFIKLPTDISGEVLTKSSVARTFVLVETAPWVHPGYRGCLTLEIANVSNTPVLLYPGMRICQLVLMAVGRPDSPRREAKKKLSPDYLGPIYPEPSVLAKPDAELRHLHIRTRYRIPPPMPDRLERG